MSTEFIYEFWATTTSGVLFIYVRFFFSLLTWKSNFLQDEKMYHNQNCFRWRDYDLKFRFFSCTFGIKKLINFIIVLVKNLCQ